VQRALVILISAFVLVDEILKEKTNVAQLSAADCAGRLAAARQGLRIGPDGQRARYDDHAHLRKRAMARGRAALKAVLPNSWRWRRNDSPISREGTIAA
jgi:hypothetical protein